MKNFKDKVIVITGGATGIGFAFAEAFGRDGAKVLLAAHQEDRLKEAISKLTALGINARYKTCDVTKHEDINELAEFAWNSYSQVDVVMNNAGVALAGSPVLDTSFEDVHRIFDVNFLGVWYGSAIFGRRFIEQGTPAAIYNVGSENSLFHGVPGGSAYVASKHAVLALTESLREEMPSFIDVSLICPGFVRSELGSAEQMALAMDTSRFVDIAMNQLRANEFLVVSHSYNVERITARYRDITRAYETYAPRYDGDIEFDVRSLADRLSQ